MEAIIALSGAALGGLIAWLVGWHQHWLETQERRNARRLEKLEELYEVLESIRFAYTARYVDNFRQNLPEFEKSDIPSAVRIADIPFGRLKMLVGLYAESLREHYDTIIERCKEFGDLTDPQRGNDSESEAFLRLRWEVYQKVQDSISAAMTSVEELARNQGA